MQTFLTLVESVQCTSGAMPLVEVPQNHIRRNGQLSQSPGGWHESRLHTGKPDRVENEEILRKPSSIQSMLRNTTETGDVGQFSIKPMRVTTSSPRASPASSKARASPSNRRHPAQYYNGQYGHSGYPTQDLPRKASTTSNGSGSHHQGRRRPRRMPSFEGYQSHMMMAPGSYYQGLNSRHPSAHAYSRSRADAPINRSQSPFAYPTRLKRPGYRPSSPSLSELNKAMINNSWGSALDLSTRTTSPSSAYHLNRTPSPFTHVADHSDPNLQHYPPYLRHEATVEQSPPASSARPFTPKPSSSLKSKASSARLQRKRSITDANWLHPQPSTVSPIFYDYTEEFDDNNNLANTSLSSRFLPEQGPYIESSTYSELGGSSESTRVAELPSDLTPRKIKPQNHETTSTRGTFNFGTMDDGFTQTALQDLSDVPELPESEMAATEAEPPLRRFRYGWYESTVHPALSKSKSLPNVEAAKQLVLESEDRSQTIQHGLAVTPRMLAVSQTITQDSISPVASMFSAKSSLPLEPNSATTDEIHGANIVVPNQVRSEISLDDFHHGHTSPSLDKKHPSDCSRGPSFEGHSQVSTEILSPTPERSIISPISRDRFSKILSIEENPMHVDMLVPPIDKDERIDSPMQAIPSSYTGRPGIAGPLPRNGSRYYRDSVLKRSIVDNTMTGARDSDSEEEPELTIALRRTFCKEDGDVIDQRVINPLILPSQLAHHRFGPPTTVRRSSAIRRSNTSLSEPPNERYIAPDRQSEPARTSTEQATQPISVKRIPTDKELPQVPKKQVSLKTFSPAVDSSPSELPFDFIPLIHRPSEDDSISGPGTDSTSDLRQGNSVSAEPYRISQPMSVLPSSDQTNEVECAHEHNKRSESSCEVQNKRNSATSPHASIGSQPGSRPWNLDSSYPWNDQLPKLDVTMPQHMTELQKSAEKTPRFKLKIHRASSPTIGTKLKKNSTPSAISRVSKSPSHDLMHGPAFRRKKNADLSIFPGQINSSHDIVHSSRQKTRFVETFETQSPTVSLQPPSAGYEVRSFFSDDSSQTRTKPSFIKRFSGYRARSAAARATSVDEARSYDRGLLNSALARSRISGRSSRQSRNTGRTSRHSQYTAGPSLRSSQARFTGWRMVDKIRAWFYRGGGSVRGLGWTKRYRRGNNRSASTPLYAGV